ncbi:hypothetical protein LINPERPRIM_LOCUS37651 [Linum perenne]
MMESIWFQVLMVAWSIYVEQ